MLPIILAVAGFILGMILAFLHPQTRQKHLLVKIVVGILAGFGLCILLNLAREGAEYAGIIPDFNKKTREEVELYVKEQLQAESNRSVEFIHLSSTMRDEYTGEARMDGSTYALSAVAKNGQIQWHAKKKPGHDYAEKNSIQEVKTPSMPVFEYSKDVNSKLDFTSKHGTYSIHLLPNTWNKSKVAHVDDAEIEYDHVDKGVYACVIAEDIGGTIQHLKKSNIDRMLLRDPMLTVSTEEKRKINGKEVLYYTVLFTANGIKMAGLFCLYADSKCMIQSWTITGRNIFAEMKPDMEQFINGIVIK